MALSNEIKHFAKDARSYYKHKCGADSLSKACSQSSDPMFCYHNFLNKNIIDEILFSCHDEYNLNLNIFDIAYLLISDIIYDTDNRRMFLRRYANRDRSKFSHNKENRILKKDKKNKRTGKYDSRRSNYNYRRSKRYGKFMCNKKNRQEVRTKLNSMKFDEIINSSKDYYSKYDPWW